MSHPQNPPLPPEAPHQVHQGEGPQLPAHMPGQGHGYPQQPSGPGVPPAPQFYAAAAPKQSKKLLWIGLAAGFSSGVLLTVLAAVVGTAITAAGSAASFQGAIDACSAEHKAGISVGDKGSSVTIDTKGKDDSSGASFDDASCILTSLEVPDSVISQIDDTSAMDGRQTASWEGVNASWTYHPDSGMKLILTKAKD